MDRSEKSPRQPVEVARFGSRRFGSKLMLELLLLLIVSPGVVGA